VHKSGKPNPRFVITERRAKVLDLLAQGFNESEIAIRLKVSQPTLSRDVKALNRESVEIIKTIEKDYYPLEFRNIINSIKMVVKKSWQVINDENDKWTNKDKLNALKLVVEASKTEFETLQNGPVNLRVGELGEQIKALVEEAQTPTTKNFMPPLLHQNLEDLK